MKFSNQIVDSFQLHTLKSWISTKLKSPNFGLVILFLLSQVVFWNNFSLTNYPGDIGDSRTSMLWMEHWRNSLITFERPWNIPNFYPLTNTMSGSEAYLLQGIVHTILRVLGFNIFSAYPLSILLLNVLGNLSGLAVSRVLKFSFAQTSIVVILYGTLNVFWLSRNHVQILLASWLGWIVYFGIKAWKTHSKKHFFLFFQTIILVLLSYGYAIIFLFYLFLFFVILSVIFGAEFRSILANFKVAWKNIFIGLLCASPLYFLFFRIYFSNDTIRGKHSESEVLGYSPNFVDLINVPADTNWVLIHFEFFGDFYRRINFLPGLTWEGGSSLTISVVCLSLLLASHSLIQIFRFGFNNSTIESKLVALTVLSLLFSFLVIAKIGGVVNLWIATFYHLPFFGSIRVLSRYVEIISLVFPFLLAWYSRFLFQSVKNFYRSSLIVLLSVLISLDQVSTTYGTFGKNQVFLSESVSSTLKNSCSSFYFLPDSQTYEKPYWAIPVDAFSLAINSGIPTINGTSSFVPKNYPSILVYPTDRNQAINALNSWIEDNSLKNVCLVENISKISANSQDVKLSISNLN
jgi:hypothetical protein